MTDTPKAHAVTGAFGFSGKYVARRLLDAGRRVVTLTGSPDRPDPFNGRVEARPFAFNDVQAMTESLRDVEVLYNTYWVRFNHPLFNYANAVRNTLTLFDAARSAGVERIVHVSITGADSKSPLEYFSGKGHLENALKASGINHAIVRPAVLFGEEDILINNIAWALRRFPVFCLFGDGNYHIQPVFVDDLAAIMVEQGQSRECVTVNAVGPEDFLYRDLVSSIGNAIGKKRRFISLSPKQSLRAVEIIGKLIGDVFITKDEIEALMNNALHAPGSEPTGATRLSDWAREHADSIGRVYHSELDRRAHRDRMY